MLQMPQNVPKCPKCLTMVVQGSKNVEMQMLHVTSVSQAELLSCSNIKQHFWVHPGRDSVSQSWSPSKSESVRVGGVTVRRLRHRQSRGWSDVTLSPCYLLLGFRPAVNPFQSSGSTLRQKLFLGSEAVIPSSPAVQFQSSCHHHSAVKFPLTQPKLS